MPVWGLTPRFMQPLALLLGGFSVLSSSLICSPCTDGKASICWSVSWLLGVQQWTKQPDLMLLVSVGQSWLAGGGAGKAVVFPCPNPVKWPQMPLQGRELWSLRGEAICPSPRYLELWWRRFQPRPVWLPQPVTSGGRAASSRFYVEGQSCFCLPLLSARDQDRKSLAPAWLKWG